MSDTVRKPVAEPVRRLEIFTVSAGIGRGAPRKTVVLARGEKWDPARHAAT